MLAILLSQAVTPQTPPEPPRITVGEFRSACAKGSEGSASDLAACRDLIRSVSRELETDPETSTCMSVPSPDPVEISWAAIDGVAAAEAKDDADARSAVTAALVSAYPCGITKEDE